MQIEAEHLRRDEPRVTEVLIVLLAALLLLAGTGFSSRLPKCRLSWRVTLRHFRSCRK